MGCKPHTIIGKWGNEMRFYKVMHDTRTGLIQNELLTEKELHKVYGGHKLVDIGIVVPVEISERNTFWNFGCRFEIKKEGE